MNRFRLMILMVALVVGVAAMPATASECMNCHSSPSFKVKHKSLYDYYLDFRDSVHGLAGLDCSDCHGGDLTATDPAKAHAGVRDRVRYDRIPDTCGACHENQKKAFVTSDHYRILEDTGTAPNCVTCHGAMEMDFIFAGRVKSTCAFCHNMESGNNPEVPDRADYILSKINIIKGYRSFVETNGKDQELVAELDRSYEELSAKWHRFDLSSVEQDAKELLGKYRSAKAQAVRDKRKEKRGE